MSYLLYATVCYTTFQTFVCDEYDDGTLKLRADRSIGCDSDDHKRYRALAILGLVFYVIGIPVIFLIALVRRASSGARRENEFSALEFLSGRFVDEAFWWDPLVMLFKATIGGLFVFHEESPIKFQFGVLVAFVWAMFGAAIRPFPSFWQNLGHDMLNLGVVLFLMSGQIMHSQDETAAARGTSNAYLWIVSVGMMAGVAAWMAAELTQGQWRKSAAVRYLVKRWHAAIGRSKAVHPAGDEAASRTNATEEKVEEVAEAQTSQHERQPTPPRSDEKAAGKYSVADMSDVSSSAKSTGEASIARRDHTTTATAPEATFGGGIEPQNEPAPSEDLIDVAPSEDLIDV